MLQPGPEVISKEGGLQSFTDWNGPMMTDSGGYQIFSLGYGSVSEEIKGKNVVCIICGGNNDRRRIPEIQLRSNRWINQFLK